MSYLGRPHVKQWGWVLFFGLACFAAGNYHVTQEAVIGSAQWWQAHEKRDLSAAQRQAWTQCIRSYSD